MIKPLQSTIWYIVMAYLIVSVREYFSFILILSLSLYFTAKNLHSYFKKDKSLKVTCVIHCAGVAWLIYLITR